MPDITISLTSEQATRLQDSWRVLFKSQPNLTNVKARLVADLKNIVHKGERKIAVGKASAAVIAPPQPFDPT